MKKLPVIIICLITILAAACSKGRHETASEPIPVQKEYPAVPDTVSRKLVKEADLNFRTDDMEATAIQLRLLVNSHKGYIAEENRTEYESEKGYDMVIRIPAGDFERFVQKILSSSNIQQINRKSIRVNDVTSEFIDVQTRLKIKKETEAHYIELLKSARNLEETIALEDQLSDLRTEIESAEGRMKFLNSQVDYSTVNVSFSERKGMTSRFMTDLSQAFKGGWQLFLKVIIALAYLWVLILAFLIGRYAYIRYRKARKKASNS